MKPRRGRLRDLTGREIAKAALLGLAAVLLALLVFRTSAVDALLRLQPNAALRVSPGDPRAAMGAAMMELGRRNGTISRRSSERAIAALERAPLAETPLLLAGLIARARGDTARGELLLAEAMRRNPRARVARIMLLDTYVRTNRIKEAAEEISVLTALIPQTTDVLVPELARMVQNPRTRQAMIDVLRRDPDMQQAVLAQLATTGANPDLILKIAGSARPSAGPAPAWQSLLVEKLVEKGDFRRAHRLWRSFLGLPAAPGDEKGLYDGRLQGLPGSPPFNWKLNVSNAGVAERVKDPAMEVAYYGRLPAELASQVLMLRPGRYRLRFVAEGSASGEGSRLVWTLECRPGEAKPLELPLVRIDYSPRPVAASFAIPPAGCSAQWLRLTGVQGEFPAAQNVTIRDIQIVPGGGK